MREEGHLWTVTRRNRPARIVTVSERGGSRVPCHSDETRMPAEERSPVWSARLAIGLPRTAFHHMSHNSMIVAAHVRPAGCHRATHAHLLPQSRATRTALRERAVDVSLPRQSHLGTRPPAAASERRRGSAGGSESTHRGVAFELSWRVVGIGVSGPGCNVGRPFGPSHVS